MRSVIRSPIKRVFPTIVLFALLLLSGVGGLLRWMKPPAFQQHQAWLDAMVARIERGELVPINNLVRLPTDAPRGAWGERIDTVYVSGSASQGWAMFFPYWRGKGTNIEGFLYLSPAQRAASFSMPVYWGPPGPPGSTPPTASELQIEAQLNANWSIAAWRMD